MLHANELIEVSLHVSAAGYLTLLLHALSVRDGLVWNVWRWNIFFGLAATSTAIAFIHVTPLQTLIGYGWTFILAIVIALGCLGGAITNMILALHLRRLLRAEGGMPIWPGRRRRRRR